MCEGGCTVEEKRFESAVTITDVFRISQELKEEGCDPLIVNQLASKRKRELAAMAITGRKLTRKHPTSIAVRRQLYTQFVFEPKFLNTGKIVFDNGKIII